MIYATSQDPILADFITNQFGRLSLTFVKPTVIVLNNARIHTAAQVKEQSACWQQRELFLFYLPPLLAASKYCRKALERTQDLMGQARGLSHDR